MKFHRRAKNIAISAVLVFATMTTWFTGCGQSTSTESNNKANNDIPEDNQQLVQDYEAVGSMYAKISSSDIGDYEDTDQDYGQYDPEAEVKNAFDYVPDAKVVETLRGEGTPVADAIYLGQNQVYRDNEDSSYYIIDGDERLTVVQSGGGYIIPESAFDGQDSLVVYAEQKTTGIVVFKSEEVFEQFYQNLQKTSNGGVKPFVLNGTTVGNNFEPKEVSTARGTESFYNLNIVVETYNAFARKNPQRYGTMELSAYDSKTECITITRKGGGYEISETLPCSTTGELFWYTGQRAIEDEDKTDGSLYDCPVMEDNNCYVSYDLLYEVYGIEIIDGSYYFYPTNSYLPAYIGTTVAKGFEIKAQTSNSATTEATTTPAVTTTTIAQDRTTKPAETTTTAKANGSNNATTTTTASAKITTASTSANSNGNNNNSNNVVTTQAVQSQVQQVVTTQAVQTQATTQATTQAPQVVTTQATTQAVQTQATTQVPQVVETEAPAETNSNNNSDNVLVDGHGNTYPSGEGYAKIGDVVFKTGTDGESTAQNYASAIEAYYGIAMEVSGNSVLPACWGVRDKTGSLDELNAWRAGRTPEEIGVTEIINNWTLINNDSNFKGDCKIYLQSLNLCREFASASDFVW